MSRSPASRRLGVARRYKLRHRPLNLNDLNTPLQAEGLSRRVYPFLGIAIVGLVSLHCYSAVMSSPVLAGASLIEILLVIAPLSQIDTPARGGVVTAAPVVVGFG